MELRARIIHSIRNFFNSQGFLEVETPLILTYPAPELHIEPISTENGVLQTSPELGMKRLLGAGYEKIFQICKCFRKGERGGKHLPEFTMLEWYCCHSNYLNLMETCEQLFSYILKDLNRNGEIVYKGNLIDLSIPWARMSVREAFEQFSDLEMSEALAKGIFDEIFVEQVEPHLGFKRPLFLYDYPACDSAMAKLKAHDSDIAERFELYIAGVEIANGFSELNDPEEQRKRFENVIKERKKAGLPYWNLPEAFLQALGSMPEAAGIAMGIDRLIMVFADVEKIDNIVAFTCEEV